MSTASDRLVPRDRRTKSIPSLPLPERHLAALYAGISEAVYIKELSSDLIVYWSRRAAELFDYAAAEVLHQTEARLYVSADPAHPSWDAASELSKNNLVSGRRSYRRRDGSVFDAEITASLWRSDESCFAVMVVRDVKNRDDVHAPGLEINRKLA